MQKKKVMAFSIEPRLVILADPKLAISAGPEHFCQFSCHEDPIEAGINRLKYAFVANRNRMIDPGIVPDTENGYKSELQ